MLLSRRRALQLTAASAVAPVRSLRAEQGTQPRVRLAVSTYSYWHFKTEKYPIEKVIEHAAELGFDGVEILHRQMADESLDLDYPRIAGILRKASFHGWVSLEMEGKEQAASAVPKSLEVLRRAFGR